jgi:hypothetical protein
MVYARISRRRGVNRLVALVPPRGVVTGPFGARTEGDRMTTFKLKTADGTSADSRSMRSAVPNWTP